MEEQINSAFDMSLETLRRINNLINQCHLSSQGLFCAKYEIFPRKDNEYYLLGLDRLFMEAQCKMIEKEITKCKFYRNEIIKARNKWINVINFPTITDDEGNRITNMSYEKAWIEIKEIARSYEVFLMQTMDAHNMLLKLKDLVTDSIYGGD